MVPGLRPIAGIYAQIGSSTDEVFFPTGMLMGSVTAADTLHREYTTLNGRPIRKDEDLPKLVGKSVFVSHTIRGHTRTGREGIVYRMHRLSGLPEHDADTIRRAMCQAKTEMLQRLRDYSECSIHLDCSRDLFDFTSRINLALELISHFPEASPTYI